MYEKLDHSCLIKFDNVSMWLRHCFIIAQIFSYIVSGKFPGQFQKIMQFVSHVVNLLTITYYK